MYVSDSLNLLTNLFLQYASQGKAESYDVRYADIVEKKKENEKQETAEDIINRLTTKIKGGKQ